MKKKIIITLVIILLLLATFGASVAIFSYATENDGIELTIHDTNKGFKFIYTELTEVGNGIDLSDTEPVSDNEGKTQSNYFEFKIEAAKTKENFTYEIVLEQSGGNKLPEDVVKFVLTEVKNGTEHDIDFSKNASAGGSIKTLNEYYDTDILNQDGKTVYLEEILAGTESYEKVFRARVFLKDGIEIDDTTVLGKETTFRINAFVMDSGNGDSCQNYVGHAWGFDENTITYTNNCMSCASTKPVDPISPGIINQRHDGVSTVDFSETFTAPCDGKYKIEVWGAQGIDATYSKGGYGGYSVGNYQINKDDNLYVYVGTSAGYTERTVTSSGGDSYEHIKSKVSGYNGGAIGLMGTSNKPVGQGGGATDVRLVKGSPVDDSSLASRIIVAGGGGGAGEYYNSTTPYANGGSGGGYIGGTGTKYSNNVAGTGGTQSAGGTANSDQNKGSFGFGGVGTASTSSGGGGGGGYYGGAGGYCAGGGGGSGYIADANLSNKGMYCYNCTEDLVNESTFTVNTNGTSTYADKVNCPDGYSSSPISKCAKAGDGYAKITFLGNTELMPSIEVTSVKRNVNVKSDATATNKIIGYSITTSDNNNPAYVQITPTDKLDVTVTASEPGIHYVWLKLEDGNITKKQFTITEKQYGCIYDPGDAWDFTYATDNDGNGTYQKFDVPCNGKYKIELWGATGGGSRNNGSLSASKGAGGYTAGNITLSTKKSLYFYVGEKGADAVVKKYSPASWNGGGQGTCDGTGTACTGADDESAGAGGGATDVRYFGTTYVPTIEELAWDSELGLNSRIMVAAGGGGRSWGNETGNAGGLIGGKAPDNRVANQTSGYAFGKGEDALGAGNSDGQGGGGGGYYGGFEHSGSGTDCGGGGSSYISGHLGSIAIAKDSISNPRAVKDGCDTITSTNKFDCSVHYSGLYFTKTVMIDGVGHTWTETDTGIITTNYMPNPSGGTYASGKGHNGAGYARITYLGD